MARLKAFDEFGEMRKCRFGSRASLPIKKIPPEGSPFFCDKFLGGNKIAVGTRNCSLQQ